MTSRLLLGLLLSAGIAGAEDLRLSASCDDQGNLVLHGEGPFGSGETVEIRLLKLVGSSREYKAGKQVQSAARMFDAMLEPGDLPPGEYVVEVRVAGLAAAVGVQLSSLKAVELAREEEQKVLLGLYRRLRAEAKDLEEAIAVADAETRASRLRTWEKGATALAKEIERREVTQLTAAKQALSQAVGLLVVLSRVHRGVADEEMGDLLKKHMVLREDGTPREASDVLEVGRRDFGGALADAFAGVMRKSMEELDRALAKVQGKKREFDGFRSTAGAWAARVSKSCDREKGNVPPDGPYPEPVADDVSQLRAWLRDLADAYCQTFDRDLGPGAFTRINELRGRIETRLTQIVERARQ